MVSLDWDHLAEELEDMAAAQKGELVKRMATLFEHFLKMASQPEERRARERKVTIVNTRNAIEELLKPFSGFEGTNRGFSARSAYGCKQAGTALGMFAPAMGTTIPSRRALNLEQLLDEDFFPDPFELPDDE